MGVYLMGVHLIGTMYLINVHLTGSNLIPLNSSVVSNGG